MNVMTTGDKVPGEIRRSPNKILRFFINFLLPLAALACGAALTFYLLNTGPEAKPRKRPPTATLVEVTKVFAAPQATVVSGMGEIVPAREVVLKPRVSGEILETDAHFLPGGYFEAGETMLKIDRADYELAAEQLASQALQTRSDLALEMGNQRIAARELELMGESVSEAEKELILRQPQLAKLQAANQYAESRLEKAYLDLKRTEIKAPFNGVITSRGVETGARVSESTELASLVGTDAFWLQLTLPVEKLGWVRIPMDENDYGAAVKVFPQSGPKNTFRTGEVIRLEAALETQGRMARILVKIDDPLSLRQENRDKPKLLLGSYVRAEIAGIPVASGIRISRANLHDNDTVWLMDDEGKLEIRPVEVLFRGQDHVIVNGSIEDGERIITSSMTSPIAGIPLRLEEDGGENPRPGMKKGEGKGQGAGRQQSAE